MKAKRYEMSISKRREADGLGREELTGNLQAMPARTIPIDVGSEYEITCGDEKPAHLYPECTIVPPMTRKKRLKNGPGNLSNDE